MLLCCVGLVKRILLKHGYPPDLGDEPTSRPRSTFSTSSTARARGSRHRPDHRAPLSAAVRRSGHRARTGACRAAHRDAATGEVSLAGYEGAANALVPLRADFSDGHFRLPWFVVAFWTHVLLAARNNGSDLPANIQAQAQREMQFSLFSLGMGTSPGDVERMLGTVAAAGEDPHEWR
jgi:hypothetical protein